MAIRAFMDTDAGGQVGGMSASEGTRRELAGKSRGWVCGGCGGRSCEDILREQEVLCKEVGREGAEEENALVGKIGLVDPKKDGSAGGDATSGAVDDSTAVASTSPATLVNAAALPASQQLPTPDPTPTPTRTTPMPTSQTQARPPPAPQRLHTTATDAWIDKAIIGVVIALVLLVLRRMA